MYTGRGIAAIGVAFNVADTNKHAFSLTDPNISYPYTTNETVSTAVLIVVSLVAPAAIIVLLTLLVVPSPKGFSGVPQALVWRHKAWEWNAGWMGLGISLAAAYMATQGLKDLVGKPRPDLLARCNPDLSKIAVYTVGGLGKQMTGAPNLVTWQICQNKSDQLKIDGFSSFPSGHTSCKHILVLIDPFFFFFSDTVHAPSLVCRSHISGFMAVLQICNCISVPRACVPSV
jgi:PAP2 superfamily protein